MISYQENTETKLKFTTYPHAKIVTYTVPIIAMVFVLYWSLYYSPIESSLICHRTVSEKVDCTIEEKSILNPFLTRMDIEDLKKAPKLGISQGQITLEANYNPKLFNLIKNPQIYHFPTKPKTIIEFSNFNLRDPFKIFKQADRINQFIAGKQKLDSLIIKQSFSLITFMVFALPVILIPLLFLVKVLQWLKSNPFYTTFEFNKNDIAILKLMRYGSSNEHTNYEYHFL